MSPGKPIVDFGFLSTPVVSFHNVVISLKKKGFPKDLSWSFLQDKSIGMRLMKGLIVSKAMEAMTP